MTKKSQNDWSFSDHLLPLIEIYLCFGLNQFDLLAGFESDENKL